MFWTIFFAVLAAMCAPMVVTWLVIGGVSLAGFIARLRPRPGDSFAEFLWFTVVAVTIGMAVVIAAGTR